jgi:WD40 repeat protein
MIKNPFPGPQPYRASDRERFYGREDVAYKLECSLLTNRCITVYGPSGAGKSSLLQAAVIPTLIEYQDVRLVRVDGWPEHEDPSRWMANAMYTDLGLGALPADLPPTEAVLAGARRAARGSSRLMVIYLDQLEQLLSMDRTLEETEPFFTCLQELVELPLRSVRVILSLREDYLGRFRDRVRDRQRALDGGFRVGPLTVAELTQAVCKAAAAGEPSQTWSPEQMRTLMLQVRVPGQAATDEAEAQSAYAQIVCRALFQQRAQGEASESYVIEAEPILRRYLETTLSDLGPLREAAQRLLEDHLVTADGSRTLRTEKELLRILPQAELLPILRALEGAAILHAEEHQGSRYFEIGHDWLAHKVFEQRQERAELEEQRRREEEQERELERQRKEADERLGKARRQRRTLGFIAGASLVVAAVTGVLGFWALVERKEARTQKDEAQAQKDKAEAARSEAVKKRVEAYDQRVLAGFLALSSQGELAWAMKLLPEVKRPAERLGWVSYASDALNANTLRVTLRGHTASLNAAAFSPDGKRVLTASSDGTARVWSADGKGEPVVLKGHEGPILSAAWSPDGERVLTTSEDRTARVWSADGKGEPAVLKGAEGDVVFGAWSPDSKRVVTVANDMTARIYAADGSGEAIKLGDHTKPSKPLTCAMFLPDGLRVVTASSDGTAWVWSADGKGQPVVLKEHKAAVLFVTTSPDGKRIVTASRDGTARVWSADGKGTKVMLKGHEGEVLHAAVSPDGTRVATASGDRTARIWKIDGTGEPVVLRGHTSAVTHVAFQREGQFVATASSDHTVRIWSVDGGGARLVLQGHSAPLRSVVWSPDGALLLTAAADRTAKVWSAESLRSLPREQRDAGFFHAASISADGALVVAAYDDNKARLRRVDGAGEPVVFEGHTEWVASALLSPTGDRVVTASFDKTARVWSADGKGEPVVLQGHEAAVRFAAFSPDGKLVVTVSDDKTARVFRADGSGEPAVLKGHEDWLTSAAVSPDGSRVVTTSLDHTVRVFRADGSGESIELKGHGGAVSAAAWSRDGKRIVTASEDGSARIWNADGSGRPIGLLGRGEAMLRAAFSEDGKRVAASSVDGLIHVWSADGKGQPIVLQVVSPAIALSFGDKDQTLLTVASDQRTHTWRIDVSTLREGLASAHADCLPAEKRTLFLGETNAYAEYAFAVCESRYGRRQAPRQRPLGGDDDMEAWLFAGAARDERGEAPSAEAAPGESALAPALSSLKDLGPNGRRVKVIVLPGDAEVEVAGAAVRRRDGVVELIGRVGDGPRLRVIKGATYDEKDVLIQDGGASPPLIDLRPKIALKAGPAGKKPSKPGEGVWDALMPKTFDDPPESSTPKPR